MKILTQTPVAFLGFFDKTSKDGKPYTMVVFGDAENYQQLQFLMRDDLDIPRLKVGDLVFLEIELVANGYYLNTNLVAVHEN